MTDRDRHIDWLREEIRRSALRGDSPRVHALHRELTTALRCRAIQAPPLRIVTRSIEVPATVKALVGEQRTFEGWASTPATDRIGDQIDARGAKYRLPLPLLWHHKHDNPVGHVTEAKASASGLWIKANVATLSEPGLLRDLCDMAWSAVRNKLVTGLSVGFRPLEYQPLEGGKGLKFTKIELMEISLVTIPANQAAAIARIG